MRQKNTVPRGGESRYENNYYTDGNAVGLFADAVYRDTGAIIHPVADGELHRFGDPEGKRHNRACWYVLHLNGLPTGVYGNWRTGYQYTWRANTIQEAKPVEHARVAAYVRQSQQQREQETQATHAEAAKKARKLWRDAIPAAVNHPYLVKKQITTLGLRQTGNCLLVPLHDIHGNLVNLQRINAAGEKRFLKGGRLTGCFALVGAHAIPADGEVYIAEGWATAATVAAPLELPVVAAMNAGNLKAVAVAICKQYPRLALVVAADNDHRTPGNPGIRKGEEAAQAIQGGLTWPSVCMMQDCMCTDFNDTAHCVRLQR